MTLQRADVVRNLGGISGSRKPFNSPADQQQQQSLTETSEKVPVVGGKKSKFNTVYFLQQNKHGKLGHNLSNADSRPCPLSLLPAYLATGHQQSSIGSQPSFLNSTDNREIIKYYLFGPSMICEDMWDM